MKSDGLKILLCWLAIAAQVFSCNSLSAQVINVSPSNESTTGSRSITGALAMATEGTHIHLAAGVYREFIKVSKADIRITGDPGAVIKPPDEAGPSFAVISVTAPGVTLEGLTIAVDSNTSCGILVQGKKSDVAGINLLHNILITTGSARGDTSRTGVSIQNIEDEDQLTAIVQGNVFGTSGSLFQGDGLHLEGTLGVIGGASEIEQNTFHCSGNGLRVVEPRSGSVLIQNNIFNGSPDGCQLELLRAGNNAVVAIDGNRFTGSEPTSPTICNVRIESSETNNARVSFYRNSIKSGKVGLELDGLMNGYIHGNTWSATQDGSTLIRVSALSDETSTRTLILTGNSIYNPGKFQNVCGMEISGTVQDRTFVLGDARAPNMFGENLETYIRLQKVSPASSNDVVALNNTFNLNGRAKKPSQSSLEELASIRQKIQDGGDKGQGGRVFLFAPVLNVNSSKYFSTIQAALDDEGTKDGDTLQLYPTTFTECLKIKKQVTLEPQNAGLSIGRPVLRSEVASVKTPALIQVAAANVKIRDIDVALSPAHVGAGVVSANSDFDNIEIQGVRFFSSNPSVRMLAIDLVNLSRLPRKVTILGNHLSDAGLHLQACYGKIGEDGDGNGNDIKAQPADIIVRNTALGEMVIRNNTLRGGGVDISETQASAKVAIEENRFEPEMVCAQGLLLRHNYSGAPVTVRDNTFRGHLYRGILSAGSNSITIDSNTFDTGSTPSLYRMAHIELNTRWPGPLTAPLNPNSCTIIGNEFLNAGDQTVAAIYIADGYAGRQSPDFSSLVIGSPEKKNSFHRQLTRFIEYSNLPDYTPSVDIDIHNNLFDTGNGVKEVPSRYSPENFRIEDKIYHKLDDSRLGRATWNEETVYLTAPGQESTDSDLSSAMELISSVNSSVFLESGIYGGSTPLITGKTTFTLASLPGSNGTTISTGLHFRGNNRNIIVQNIGMAGNPLYPNQPILNNEGTIDGLSLVNVNIDGGQSAQSGISGGSCLSQVTISNSRLSNISGPISFNLAGNTTPKLRLETNKFENCTGPVYLDFHTSDSLCIASGNEFTLPPSDTSSAPGFVIIHGSGMTSVVNNSWHGSSDLPGGKSIGLHVKNPRQLYLANNQFENLKSGVTIEAGMSSQWLSIINNTFSGTGVPFTTAPSYQDHAKILIANNLSDNETIPNQPDSVISTASAGAATVQAKAKDDQTSVRMSPLAGTYRGGETLEIYLYQHLPFQKLSGIPKSLIVRTSLASGGFISTVAMSYTTRQISSMTETQLYLACWDPRDQKWIPAVARNTKPAKVWMGASVPLDPLPENLGKYGVDPVNNQVWAVVDTAGEFSISGGTGTGAVPVNLSDFTID